MRRGFQSKALEGMEPESWFCEISSVSKLPSPLRSGNSPEKALSDKSLRAEIDVSMSLKRWREKAEFENLTKRVKTTYNSASDFNSSRAGMVPVRCNPESLLRKECNYEVSFEQRGVWSGQGDERNGGTRKK